jgi:EmrB/QacA subfamily drug resistance transporter
MMLAMDQRRSRYSQRETSISLVIVFAVTFIAAMDQTIVVTALPQISRILQDPELASWVTSVYLLCSTSASPVYGKLADIFGRKRILLFGLMLFLVGSALSGMAPTMISLIACRVVQGVGGGAMIPSGVAVISELFDPRERGRWQGFFQGAVALAAVVGPLVGGWITQHISWHWVFLVNLPIGISLLVFMLAAMPEFRSRRAEWVRVDYLGAALVVMTAMLLLFALNEISVQHSLSPLSEVCLGGSALGLISLLFYERHVERAQGSPIINISLYTTSVRIFAISALAVFVVGIFQFGMLYLIPLFLQSVLRLNATYSGGGLALLSLGALLGSIITGNLLTHFGRYKGMAILSQCTILLAILTWIFLPVPAPLPWLIGILFLAGFGLGLSSSIYTVAVQNGLPRHFYGQATAAMAFYRLIGGSIGVALIGFLINSSSSVDANALSATSVQQGEHLALLSLLAIVGGGCVLLLFLKDAVLLSRHHKMQRGASSPAMQRASASSARLSQWQTAPLREEQERERAEADMHQSPLAMPRLVIDQQPFVALIGATNTITEAVRQHMQQILSAGAIPILLCSKTLPEGNAADILSNDDLFRQTLALAIQPLLYTLITHRIQGVYLLQEPGCGERTYADALPALAASNGHNKAGEPQRQPSEMWEQVIAQRLALLAWSIGIPVLEAGPAMPCSPTTGLSPCMAATGGPHTWLSLPAGPQEEREAVETMVTKLVTTCLTYSSISLERLATEMAALCGWLRQRDKTLLRQISPPVEKIPSPARASGTEHGIRPGSKEEQLNLKRKMRMAQGRKHKTRTLSLPPLENASRWSDSAEP